MAADALDVRMARLEGAYEQINTRLGSIDAHLGSLETRMETRFGAIDARFTDVDRKLDSTFRWVIGVILVNWVTVMLAILVHR